MITKLLSLTRMKWNGRIIISKCWMKIYEFESMVKVRESEERIINAKEFRNFFYFLYTKSQEKDKWRSEIYQGFFKENFKSAWVNFNQVKTLYFLSYSFWTCRHRQKALPVWHTISWRRCCTGSRYSLSPSHQKVKGKVFTHVHLNSLVFWLTEISFSIYSITWELNCNVIQCRMLYLLDTYRPTNGTWLDEEEIEMSLDVWLLLFFVRFKLFYLSSKITWFIIYYIFILLKY